MQSKTVYSSQSLPGRLAERVRQPLGDPCPVWILGLRAAEVAALALALQTQLFQEARGVQSALLEALLGLPASLASQALNRAAVVLSAPTMVEQSSVKLSAS